MLSSVKRGGLEIGPLTRSRCQQAVIDALHCTLGVVNGLEDLAGCNFLLQTVFDVLEFFLDMKHPERHTETKC